MNIKLKFFKLKTICLSGGGINGFAHIGMLQKLVEENVVDKVDTIVASSIGGVIGMLFLIDMKPLDIYCNLVNIDDSILKFTNIDRFFLTYGLDTGEYFMAHLVDIFIMFNCDPCITFLEFFEKYKKRLILTGTNITMHKPEFFCVENYPSMKVLDAIRITISIPFLFCPVSYNNNVYVDGGVSDNYPIKYAKSDFLKRNLFADCVSGVIGLNLDSLLPKNEKSFENFIYNIFACTMKKDTLDSQNSESSINLCLKETTSFQFNASKEKRQNLFSIGYISTCEYLDNLDFAKNEKISRRYSI